MVQAYGLPVGSVFRCLLEQGVEIAVPESWSVGVNLDHPQRQECAPTAFRYVKEHPRIRGMAMIHGSIFSLGEGRRIGHTWVRLRGDVVFDGVLQRFYTWGSYHRVAQAHAGVAYTRAEVLRGFDYWQTRADRRIHLYGPWPDRDPEGEFCSCVGRDRMEAGLCSAYRRRMFGAGAR
jgi:hypothetical protein